MGKGMGRERGCASPSPEIFLILGLEIAY